MLLAKIHCVYKTSQYVRNACLDIFVVIVAPVYSSSRKPDTDEKNSSALFSERKRFLVLLNLHSIIGVNVNTKTA